MVAMSSKTHVCGEGDCFERQSADERIALAESICRSRGSRLTPLRADVLKLMWASRQPLGAYELIDRLTEQTGSKINPPTVYRALDFLIEQDFVTRIASNNTFVPCPHPERPHTCLFFICGGCGSSTEIEDARIEQLLTEDASDIGFNVTHRVVELQGTCASCEASSP